MKRYLSVFVFIVCIAGSLRAVKTDSSPAYIVKPQSSAVIDLAAKEVRRYVYLTTGQLLPISNRMKSDVGMIIIGTKECKEIKNICSEMSDHRIEKFEPEEFLIKTVSLHGKPSLILAGASEISTLYAAYQYAEEMGVRFYMHGDVIPEEKKGFLIPEMNKKFSPLFETRGIQPFHDFPEGPDWWNRDDYKAIFAQIVKMKMNFFGLHTYPQGGVGPEPLVWIGRKQDINPDGTVTASYPARHFTTHNITGSWGYKKANTSDYAFGAGQIFERDDFGADYMQGVNPWPDAPPEKQNNLFNDMGSFLDDIFSYARDIGIKTCIGTETPLVIPSKVKDRLKSQGKDPSDPRVIQEVYEAMFMRISKTHPLDYYWFWTPEHWTWQGETAQQLAATMQDFKSAIAAAKDVNPSFTLATCGWVLGPKSDRALFDNTLPKEMPFSCINRQVGFEFVETGFDRIKGRRKWAIPWMEDDPAMISPQLWAGRMRQDAVDALSYGCDGLMGIHWRTRILGPNVSALAKAAWDQSYKPPAELPRPEPVLEEGCIGGNNAGFPNNEIKNTSEDPVYQTVRYDVKKYNLKIPDGTYSVTLKFCEPHYNEKSKRAFGVKVENRRVIERLDIFDEVGKDRALDYTFNDINIQDGFLNIEFIYDIEYPSIAGIVISGKTTSSNQYPGRKYLRKVNCGGPAWGDYQADIKAHPETFKDRDMPVKDFYDDWCLSQFGPEAAGKLSKIFTGLDGGYMPNQKPYRETYLPRPSTWVRGPGGIVADSRPWSQVSKEYEFVNVMESVRPEISGQGNLERFDYWINQFRYLRSTGKVSCTWGHYNRTMAMIKQQKDPAVKKRIAIETAIPARKQLIANIADAINWLMCSVNTPGAMGNITNWQQHVMNILLVEPADELEKILDNGPLPSDLMPSKGYEGPARLFVPTVRGMVQKGEDLEIKAICQGADIKSISIHYRSLGSGDFTQKTLNLVNRGVYSVGLDNLTEDIEYYIKAYTSNEGILFWPATARKTNQTIIVMQ